VDSWRLRCRHFFADAEVLDDVALFAVGANVVGASDVDYAFAAYFDDAAVVAAVVAAAAAAVAVVVVAYVAAEPERTLVAGGNDVLTSRRW